MTRFRFLASMVLCAGILAAPLPASAVEAPYAKKLDRLAEILGSLHFLRNLCGEKGDAWRQQMEALLVSENPEPRRRESLIAEFNKGYRSFDSVYTHCTQAAIEAIDLYMKEGEELSRDIVSQYAN